MSYTVHSFHTPRTIRFGWDAVNEVGEITASIHSKALLVTGSKSADASGTLNKITRSLESHDVEWHLLPGVAHEPTDTMVDEAREVARTEGCGVIISVGGGSALDLGKATAGLFYSKATTHDHMIRETKIPDKSLPWIAIPTTAGSGSEVTPNAVLTDTKTGIKKSLRHWGWLADAAIVDPQLTVTMPPHVTAFTGMDALTQAIESYTSRGATPLTDGISLEAARLVGSSLLHAYLKGEDSQAREAVAWGAMMAGIALSNARLGVVHGFAHPVGTHCDLPHGKACAILLPWVMEYNLTVAADKYARLARTLDIASTSTSTIEAAEALVQFVRRLNEEMEIPFKLGEVGLTKDMITKIIEETMPSGSTAANPRPVTEEELTKVLEKNL